MKPEKGLRSWRRTSEAGNPTIKVTIEIDAPIIKVIDVITDPKFRSTYDTSFLSEFVAQKLEEHTYLAYMLTKKVSIVASRFFVLICHWHCTEDGTLYTPCVSVDRDDIAPYDPSLVKGHTPISGNKIVPLSSNKTEYTYLSEVNFGGYVPNFLLTNEFKGQTSTLLRVQELVKQV